MPDADPATPTQRPERYEPGEAKRVGHAVHRPDNADSGENQAVAPAKTSAVGEHQPSNRDDEEG